MNAEDIKGVQERIAERADAREQHEHELATGEGMPEAPEVAVEYHTTDMNEALPLHAGQTLCVVKSFVPLSEDAVKFVDGPETMPTIDLGPSVITRADIMNAVKALELDALIEEENAAELALSECGCDDCIESGDDDFRMLFDMYLSLKSQYDALEARIAAYNVKASHKI